MRRASATASSARPLISSPCGQQQRGRAAGDRILGQLERFAQVLLALRLVHEERNQARVRLLELFETLGNADERVLKARRDLMTALF